jgi:hypothetical protein
MPTRIDVPTPRFAHRVLVWCDNDDEVLIPCPVLSHLDSTSLPLHTGTVILKANLTMMKKCGYFKQELQFLGHLLCHS